MKTIVLSVCLLAGATAALGQDLQAILRQADVRRQEYVDAFKSLTAVETQVTELFDRNGAVETRRTIVADFLVYQSALKTGDVREYRITREVDGKPVGNRTEEGLKTFHRLAASKTIEQETKRLQQANLKYHVGTATIGGTLNPFGILSITSRDAFDFAIVGRDRLNEDEVVVVRYQSKKLLHPLSAQVVPLFREFKEPRTGARGRIWLDAHSWRARRWESEGLISGEGITTPVVFMRYVVDYGPSAFDLLTPRTIVASFFEKPAAKNQHDPRLLTTRTTYTYDAFKRFEVTTSSDVQLPTAEKPDARKP
jgi:hypothetical protein